MIFFSVQFWCLRMAIFPPLQFFCYFNSVLFRFPLINSFGFFHSSNQKLTLNSISLLVSSLAFSSPVLLIFSHLFLSVKIQKETLPSSLGVPTPQWFWRFFCPIPTPKPQSLKSKCRISVRNDSLSPEPKELGSTMNLCMRKLHLKLGFWRIQSPPVWQHLSSSRCFRVWYHDAKCCSRECTQVLEQFTW